MDSSLPSRGDYPSPDTADEWNALYPVGTHVVATLRQTAEGAPEETLRTRTRSKAWALGHGTSVVLIEGKTGGYRIGQGWMRVVPALSPSAPQKPDDVVDRGDPSASSVPTSPGFSGAEEQPSSMPEEEMEEILRELDAEEATKKPFDDVSTTAHPPVPSSGDLSAAAVESPPDGSELPGIGRPGVPSGGVSTAAYDFSDELAGLAVAFTLLGFLPDITEHEDGSASVPAHVWAELKDAIAEWGKTPTEALFLAMGARPTSSSASPAKPPHEEQTGPSPPPPLGARRPREGTSPAQGEGQ